MTYYTAMFYCLLKMKPISMYFLFLSACPLLTIVIYIMNITSDNALTNQRRYDIRNFKQ